MSDRLTHSRHRERVGDDLGDRPALEQLAVGDADRLRDDVRVRVLSHATVEQTPVVLAEDALPDGAAGAADTDRVLGLGVGRDEAVLDHDRRLAAELEVVVRVRPVTGREDDGVAEAEAGEVEMSLLPAAPGVRLIATPPEKL